MYILHCDLEPIEAPCLWNLHLRAKLLRQILKHYPIGSSKESQHIFDEVLLLLVQLLPILEVLIEIYLVGSPKRGEMLLVHLEDGVILNREEDKPLLVLLEDWLLDLSSTEGGECVHAL